MSHLLIGSGTAPQVGEDPIEAARRGIREREAAEKIELERQQALQRALHLLSAVHMDVELMGPLPNDTDHGMCVACTRRAAVWGYRVDVGMESEHVDKYCARCYLYDSPWGRSHTTALEAFIPEFEAEHGALTRHAQTRRLTVPVEVLRLLSVIWTVSRTVYMAQRRSK